MSKKLLYLICVFLLCTVSVFGIVGCHSVSEQIKLTAAENGTFKIVHFTDFHLYLADEKENSVFAAPLKSFDVAFIAYLDAVIEREEADFAVLGGDNIFCNSAFAEIFYRTSIRTYRAIAQYFEEKELYWTFVFGNHDSESGRSKQKILNALSKYRYFIGGAVNMEGFESLALKRKEDVYLDGKKLKSKYSIDDRYANYAIPVYDSSGTDIVYRIFTLDTGGFYRPPPKGVPYKTLVTEQFDWLNGIIAKEDDLGYNYMIFLHIPYFDELLEGLDAAHTGRLNGIFAGHYHFNYMSVKSVADNSVICAVTGCCQEDSAQEAGVRFARIITVDTINATATTHCLDSELSVIME